MGPGLSVSPTACRCLETHGASSTSEPHQDQCTLPSSGTVGYNTPKRKSDQPPCPEAYLPTGEVKSRTWGGTVAQTVAPTTFRLDAHGGHGFDSGPMSFLLSTPHLFSLSFPVPLFTDLLIKGLKSPKTNNIFLKKQDITRLKWSEIGE